METANHSHKLSPCCLGFSLGIVTALGLFLMALGAYFAPDWGLAAVNVLSSFYVGYEASWMGAFIGAGWGLLDGFIFGVLVGWFYNKGCLFCRQCCQKSGSCG